MNSLPIILTWEAIFDLTDIEEWIEVGFGVSRAEKFERDFRSKMETLSSAYDGFGKAGIKYRGYEIKKFPFEPSIIFYVVEKNEDGGIRKGIHVLRVLRHEQDWKKILTTEQNYTYPDEGISDNGD